MELLKAKRIYMIGIKGAGMTALAEFLVRQGIAVTGSDTEEVFFTDAILKRLGIAVKSPFASANVETSFDACIYSTAYTEETNEEIRVVKVSGKPMFSYPEALGILTQSKLTLAVCGTHGKTTTSALLAEALRGAGQDPSAIVGSEIKNWQGGALSGAGPHLVIEADEYQDKLRFYTPLGIILTSVDWDHPDFFPTVGEYEAVFERFVARLPRHGFLVACGDDARVRRVAEAFGGKKLFYGFLPENEIYISEYTIVDPESSEGQTGIRACFSITFEGETFGPWLLSLSGKHNCLNAAAVVGTFLHFKIPLDSLAGTFTQFSGTKRRFEFLGSAGKVLVFDDYAHHPEEIRATLTAFRELYPKRLLTVVFHPHTYTRTKALLEDFAETLSLADRVILIDIYGSARETQGGVASSDIVERINRVWPGKARYIADRGVVVEALSGQTTESGLIVTMGAGDVWQIAEAFIHKHH